MLRLPSSHLIRAALLALFLLGATNGAAAQTQVIVALAWQGFSAGPRAQNYPPSLDDRDIWAVEDFQTDRAWLVGRLSCTGADPRGATTGVTAFILDALPPDGRELMRSLPDTGGYVQASPWGRYEADFGGQRLPPGSYRILWGADGNPDLLLPVMFVAAGSYSFGIGTPDDAYQYNPGLWWNLPMGALDPVHADFDEMGSTIGINFALRGVPAPPCPADFNGDDTVNSQDFFDFVFAFFAGDPDADVNTDGLVNSQDFFDFVAAFFTPC